MAFQVFSVASSNPRVRRGERRRGEGRSAVETWKISYDDGMRGCMTRAMCAIAALYANYY